MGPKWRLVSVFLADRSDRMLLLIGFSKYWIIFFDVVKGLSPSYLPPFGVLILITLDCKNSQQNFCLFLVDFDRLKWAQSGGKWCVEQQQNRPLTSRWWKMGTFWGVDTRCPFWRQQIPFTVINYILTHLLHKLKERAPPLITAQRSNEGWPS